MMEKRNNVDMKLNPEISELQRVQMTDPIEYYFSRLLDNNYLIKKYTNLIIKSPNDIEIIACHNALIESTLAIIRIEYEFFFKVEIFKSDIKSLNDYIKRVKTKDDIFAEYYFKQPNQWIEIKKKFGIEYSNFEYSIAKSDIEKHFLHMTFSDKKSWIFEPVLISLYNTNRVFFEHSDYFHEYNSRRQNQKHYARNPDK